MSVFIGCIFYMACFKGILDQCEWWSSLLVDEFEGEPIQLGKYISLQHFQDNIICRDCGASIVLGRIMKTVFIMFVKWLMHSTTTKKTIIILAGWYVWDWLSKYCPGWIWDYDLKEACPIMYWVEIGKRSLVQRSLMTKGQAKTVGVMLHISKNLWNTGKIVSMDSGFSVAKGILAMREKGYLARVWSK